MKPNGQLRQCVFYTKNSLQDIPQRVCVSLEQDKNYEHSGSQCPIHHPGVDGDTKQGGLQEEECTYMSVIAAVQCSACMYV